MAYDPTKPISETNNPEGISGNIATTPTGVKIDTTTGNIIDSSALAPSTGINFQQPNPTTINPASGVPEATDVLQPTQEESNVSDLIRQITEGNTALTGKTAFTAEQQQVQGLEGLQKTQDDLNSRLQLLKANEVNIPLQLQQESIGRGRTAGGVAPLQSAALRENAISANIIGAQLAGIQGKISTANALVENAVKMKFGAQEEKQAALKANLELLLQDPKLSLADKNRANKQLQAQKAKDAQIAKDKQNYEDAQKETLKYSGIANAQQLDEMSKLESPTAVAAYAAKNGLKTQEQRKAELEQQKIQAEIAQKSPVEEQLYSGLSSPTATAVRGVVTSFKNEPAVTNFQTLQDGYNFVQSMPSRTTNPADDQGLIYALAKALDPGSVVREGEYKTAQTYSQSWIQSFGKSVEQALLGTGFLSETARKNIKETIKRAYDSKKKSYDNVYAKTAAQINNLTGRSDGTSFLKDYTTPDSDITRPPEEKIGDIVDLSGLDFRF